MRSGEYGWVMARDETPEADALEQQREAIEENDEEQPEIDFEVPEADALDQWAVVPEDEEEYR